MKSHKYEHQFPKLETKKLIHQRNFTVTNFAQDSNKNGVHIKKTNFNLKQNQMNPPRFSWFSKKVFSSTKCQDDFGFFKTRKSNCEIFLSPQHQQKSKLKHKIQQGEKKVPRFIKERQLSKSEQTHLIIPKSFQTQSQNFYSKDRLKGSKKIKEQKKVWPFSQEEKPTFEVDLCLSFGNAELEQKLDEEIKEFQQEEANKKSMKKEFGKEPISFKSTQSTISTVSNCVSLQNIFLSNLTEVQEEEINKEFKQLFSSRRVQTEQDLYKMDEELTKEFLMLLERCD